MTPNALLARASECGFAICLDETGPHIVRRVDGATLPGGFMAELRANRAALVRYLFLADAIERAKAADRPVWALTEGEPRPWVLKDAGDAGAHWIAIEGDADWTPVPRGEECES